MSGIPAGAGSLIGKRLGKYDILALLALGGTAEIYLARTGGAGGFEKYVVVKCLHDHLADDPDFVKMFLDEARLAALLDHSNIVQTFELGEYENRYYMVMEFLAGLSLAMIVRRAGERLPGGLLPAPVIFNIAAQAAAGLHYAHERTANGKPLNMVHRDISPQNLVISFEGVVKVVDFGIARAELRETKTKAGTIKGKFAYMSPEQCVATNVDRRTDVFALGVIVHELLTGRRLFKRGSPYETYQAVIECAVDPPSNANNQIDRAIDEVVMTAVAKDKDKRYPSAEAFGDALLGYLHHRGKGSGGAELSRFFEQHFAQEIEEHGDRMRELISGREVSVETGLGWDKEDDKGNMTVDLGAKKDDSAISLVTGEIEELRPSDASLERFVGDLDPPPDEDELPVERTRIELNPLETVEELNRQVARNSASRISPAGLAETSGKTPIPSATRPRGGMPVPPGSVTGVAPLPAPPAGPRPIIERGSDRSPDLPNMPTALANEALPPLAPTPVARGRIVDPSQEKTGPPLPYVPAQSMVPMLTPSSATQYASQMQDAQMGHVAHPSGPQSMPQHQAGGPYAQQPYSQGGAYSQPSEAYPQGGAYPQPGEAYPQPSGAYPQPSGAYPSGAYPQPSGAYPQPSGAYPSGAYPQSSEAYPSGAYPQQSMASYPVLPGGQRPYSSDLAPSNLSTPQRSPYANASFDPNLAANLMSPVGEHYPQTDWQRMASMPAKAMPKWLLAALFAAALGAALLLTLLIAKIFS